MDVETQAGPGGDDNAVMRRGSVSTRSRLKSESNAFARALASQNPFGKNAQRSRFIVGVTISLILSACFTIALVLLGGLIVRGVRRGDFVALGAAMAVAAMTFVMARGRRKKR